MQLIRSSCKWKFRSLNTLRAYDSNINWLCSENLKNQLIKEYLYVNCGYKAYTWLVDVVCAKLSQEDIIILFCNSDRHSQKDAHHAIIYVKTISTGYLLYFFSTLFSTLSPTLTYVHVWYSIHSARSYYFYATFKCVMKKDEKENQFHISFIVGVIIADKKK